MSCVQHSMVSWIFFFPFVNLVLIPDHRKHKFAMIISSPVIQWILQSLTIQNLKSCNFHRSGKKDNPKIEFEFRLKMNFFFQLALWQERHESTSPRPQAAQHLGKYVVIVMLMINVVSYVRDELRENGSKKARKHRKKN